MAAPSVGLSLISNRATSEGPSPPSRNSMEDADSSVTRKRPRLDSGDRTHRSMSADRILSSRASVEQGQLLPTTNAEPNEKGTPTISRRVHHYSLDRTPSKVTINVRDPNSDSSLSQQHNGHVATVLNLDDLPSSDQTTSSPALQSNNSRPISVTSSSPQSPEIEVAEIEDMDEDPGETRWKRLVSIIDPEDIQANLLDNFPFADRCQAHRQAATHVGQILEKGASSFCGTVDRVMLTFYRPSRRWYDIQGTRSMD